MTPIQQFNRQLAAVQLLKPTQTVVVAVSTGCDSMVLLTLLQRLPDQQRPHLVVAYVDHHLREQSREETAFLRAYCRQHALTLRVADWPVTAHPQHGVEAAARQFRYDFFEKVMHATNASALLTAHHANDQAETYLMKLARGGDLAQLTGIAPWRPFAGGRLVRPLLGWSKQMIHQYATAQHVTFYEDATNADLRLTRNRIRHRVIPELQRLNPELLAHVASYEQQLATLLTAKRDMVNYLLPPLLTDTAAIRLAGFTRLPSTWQGPVLSAWIRQKTGRLVSETKLEPLRHWINNCDQAAETVQLSGQNELVKVADTIDIRPYKKKVKKLMPLEKTMVDLNQWQKITARQTAGVFTDRPNDTAQPFRLKSTDGPLSFRPWQPTDRLTLKGGGHQPVRRILIDQKVPLTLRDQVCVLVNAHGTVLWVVGHKFAYRERHSGNTTVFLALKHRS